MSTLDRMQNTQGLFRARSSLSGRHVLLVDDVLTTGATLLACAQAIMTASQDVRISILTLARAS
jgi:predicted amidophosphoribosyltransferase